MRTPRPLLSPIWRPNLAQGIREQQRRLLNVERSPAHPSFVKPKGKTVSSPLKQMPSFVASGPALWAGVPNYPPVDFWKFNGSWSDEGNYDPDGVGILYFVVNGDVLAFVDDSNGTDLFVSRDGASSWEVVPFPEPGNGPWYDITSGVNGRFWLYGADDNSDLWYTDDDFASFGHFGVPGVIINIAPHLSDPMKIAFGARNGAAVSTDGGASWDFHSVLLDAGIDFHCAAWVGDTLIVVGERYHLGTDQELYWYSWTGGSWSAPTLFFGPINSPSSQMMVVSGGGNFAWCKFSTSLNGLHLFRLTLSAQEEMALPANADVTGFGGAGRPGTAVLGSTLYQLIPSVTNSSYRLYSLADADTVSAGADNWVQDLVVQPESIAAG